MSSHTTLAKLEQAMFAGQPVQLTYSSASRDAWSTRLVHPLALEQRDEHWYLRAICAIYDAERTFRVDRITTIDVLDTATPCEARLASYDVSSLGAAPTR